MAFIVSDVWAADAVAPVADAGIVDGAPPVVTAEKMLMENLLILALLFFIFYFMLIRPQQRRLKAHQTMVKALAKGNKVMTGGGIIGTIVKFEGDDIVVVEIAQNVKVRIARSSITEVMAASGQAETANDN